ncbi:MAG: hypothetical protein ACR2JI_06540 [Mycobacterium sp.]
MADQQDQPDQRPARKVSAKKAAAKNAPAKKPPVKKAAVKKAGPKKAPPKVAPSPQPALKAHTEVPALEPAPSHAALTAGPNPAREAAANAKESVRQAPAPVSSPAAAGGDSSLRIPLTIGLAAVSFIVVLLRRLRRI